MSSPQPTSLPEPPQELAFGAVRLRFGHIISGDSALGYAPAYHFRILVGGDSDAGYIHFRVGESEHVQIVAGHIGYVIDPAHRGHGYAGGRLPRHCAIRPFDLRGGHHYVRPG